MASVTIYTRSWCGYCAAEKDLLQRKGVAYTEIDDAAFDPGKKREMVAKANGRSTFPQIFIGDTHVGGCDDFYKLEHEGRLDSVLT